GMVGYFLSSIFVLWSTYSSSSIFATVLSLSHQRFLVAYPVGLLYSAFTLFVFEVNKGGPLSAAGSASAPAFVGGLGGSGGGAMIGGRF
ncbi:hypothetical protein JCM10212_005682, partial [Sporobolomyces blumeae]